MGKNKGRQSHSTAKQIMVKGTTSDSGKVLVKKAGTSSAKTDDVAHQVFDNLLECSAESESSPEVSCTLGDNDSTTDDDSSHSYGSKSSPQLDDNKAPLLGSIYSKITETFPKVLE